MKKFYILLVAIFTINIANAQWQQSFSCNQTFSICTSGNNIYAGAYGTGLVLSTDNGNTWNIVTTLFANEHVNSIAVSGNNIFVGTWNSGIFLSTDNGNTWNTVNTGLTSINVWQLLISGNNIFAATYGGGVSLSTNNGTSWTSVNVGLPSNQVNSLAIKGNTIFASIYGSNSIFISTNNGNNWSLLSSITNVQYITIQNLTINGNNIYAATNEGVYISIDNGNNWTPIGTNKWWTNGIAVHGNDIYIATDNGVYQSPNNSSSSWTLIGMNNFEVGHIAICGNTLFAGTYDNAGSPLEGIWNYPLTNNTFPIGSKIRIGADSTISYWDGIAWIPVAPGLPGQSLQFTSGSPATWIGNPNPITDIDGNVYDIVKIGTQVWMKQNLNVTHYRNGDAIPNVTDKTTWSNLSTGAYSDYFNLPSSSTTYGKLYNWYAVGDSRNICPTGWHVPSDTEWTTLTSYLGGESIAGGKLKEAGLTHWASPNTSATNETGFTALPADGRDSNGNYSVLGYNGFWWSSTLGEWGALSRNMEYNISDVYLIIYVKTYGLSVRCLKD